MLMYAIGYEDGFHLLIELIGDDDSGAEDMIQTGSSRGHWRSYILCWQAATIQRSMEHQYCDLDTVRGDVINGVNLVPTRGYGSQHKPTQAQQARQASSSLRTTNTEDHSQLQIMLQIS